MGRPSQLLVGQHVLARLLEHCMEERPCEACGILTGREGRVYNAYATDNVRRSPIFYEVDPQQQEEILKGIAGRDESLLAIYHSHPTTPAIPSHNDVQLAIHYPQALRMIVSLAGPSAEVKAYQVTDGRVSEVEVVAVSDPAVLWHDLRRSAPRPEATG